MKTISALEIRDSLLKKTDQKYRFLADKENPPKQLTSGQIISSMRDEGISYREAFEAFNLLVEKGQLIKI